MNPSLPPSLPGLSCLLAYLDPGTGALILQALVGGALAVGLFAKNIVRKVRSLFGKSSAHPDEPDTGAPPNPEA